MRPRLFMGRSRSGHGVVTERDGFLGVLVRFGWYVHGRAIWSIQSYSAEPHRGPHRAESKPGLRLR
jgi:hypothetical protein